MVRRIVKRKSIKKKFNLVDEIIAFETEGLPPAREKRLFQRLVDTGQAFQLQGRFGRQASAMIKAGVIKLPKKTTFDAFGNRIMTREEFARRKKKRR